MKGKPQYIDYDGKRLTSYGWAKITGVSAAIIYQRMKRGWDVAAALYTPQIEIKRKPRKLCGCGKEIYTRSKRDVCAVCHRKAAKWANPTAQDANQSAEVFTLVPPRAKVMTDHEVMLHVKDFLRKAGAFSVPEPCISYAGTPQFEEIARLYV